MPLSGQVCEAQKDHLEAVTALSVLLYEPDNIDDAATFTMLFQEFTKILASNRDALYVYLVDRRVVAFLHVAIRMEYVEGTSGGPVGYAEGIYVNEAYRNQGIAKALMTAGEDWAKNKGCKQMASDAELTNEDSISYHKKIGYKEINRVVCFLKDL